VNSLSGGKVQLKSFYRKIFTSHSWTGEIIKHVSWRFDKLHKCKKSFSLALKVLSIIPWIINQRKKLTSILTHSFVENVSVGLVIFLISLYFFGELTSVNRKTFKRRNRVLEVSDWSEVNIMSWMNLPYWACWFSFHVNQSTRQNKK
jgi:hypothetical protein